MARIYSYRWTSTNGESFDDAPREAQLDWVNETSGMSPEDWSRALEKCKERARDATREGGQAWPPSCVEFAVYGEQEVQPREHAYLELTKYLMSPEHKRKVTTLSPLVYHTYTQNLDSYAYRQMKSEDARRAFMAAYKITMDQKKAGIQIANHLPALEQLKPVITEKDKQRGETTINNLKGLFS